LSRAIPRGLGLVATMVTHALGVLDLGLGRPADALTHFQATLAAGPGAGSPFFAVFCVPDLVEAAVRAGRLDGVDAPYAAFRQIVGPSGAPSAQALLARTAGLLAGDDAAGHFDEALRLSTHSGRSFDRARTELLYGEWLRRAKRRSEARDRLRPALDTFERIGAAPWAERARQELRASGETARKRDPASAGQLTPQELQIVRLVTGGATNQEVGAQLFLSKRTVEYHLHNVFVKLGITSRTALLGVSIPT
jgi:DNA-binding CsgD family transcriptional regulator